MRLLHTSDWHLGRAFHGQSMLGAQAAYVDHLLDVVESERVDAVLVSGDIFDRALPSVDAVALFDDALHRLASSRARVVLSSGNHDSARRLGLNSRLIDAAGVHLRTDAGALAEPIVLEDRHGKVAVYALPYLEPDLLHQRWRLPSRSHQAAMAYALDRVRADLDVRRARSVVMAHAFVAGGLSSDSERDISVGGVSAVPLELFDGLDYAALGHLHGRQQLSETVAYSGSPLAYSFSEAVHLKGSWLVELDGDGVGSSQFVAAPVPRALVRLRGNLADLLKDPRHDRHESSWVEATLTDAVRPAQPMERLRQRFAHCLALRWAPEGTPAQGEPRRSVAGRTDRQITLDFVEHVRGEAATPAEADLMGRAVEACCGDPDLRPERDAVVSR